MIKFFRKIRQRLLAENRFSKYLLYAVGEIVLVVIGILIALQINNQNEARKIGIKEQNYLSSLKDEFEYNHTQLTKVIEANARFGDAASEILKLTGPDEPQVTEEKFIRLLLQMLNSEVQYRPSNGVLNEIISSGKLDIFKNVALKKELSSWDGLLYTIQFQETEINTVRLSLIEMLHHVGNVKQLFKLAGYDNFQLTDSRFDTENRTLLGISEFESRTMAFYSTSRFANEYYYSKVDESISRILAEIEKCLEHE